MKTITDNSLKFPPFSKINKISIFKLNFFLSDNCAIFKQSNNLSQKNTFFYSEKFCYNSEAFLGYAPKINLKNNLSLISKDTFSEIKRSELRRIYLLAQIKKFSEIDFMMVRQFRKNNIFLGTPAGKLPAEKFIFKNRSKLYTGVININIFYRHVYSSKNVNFLKNLSVCLEKNFLLVKNSYIYVLVLNKIIKLIGLNLILNLKYFKNKVPRVYLSELTKK